MSITVLTFVILERQIGSVPTPWPSWLVAAHPTRAQPENVSAFLGTLTEYVRSFDSAESREHANVKFIETNFGYPAEDIKAWLKTVSYPEQCLEIPRKVVTDTLGVLEKAGVVKAPEGGFDLENFVETKVAKLT
ncbi:hypothetical protein DXG03_001667 [Asterophora parasitica]|uniref:Uncharacterized protein n=1 Tax=Asterophora parasitica TaxID=117018 RepID=A0A9P7GAI9_9AGAR|nr:hypothetical protein DXG03_001667 [Asterophora parasitica]